MALETGRKRIRDSASITIMCSAWGMLVLVWLVSVVTLWSSWTALADVWLHRSAYSHGYIIALISLGLIFRLRPSLATEKPAPQLAGLALLAVLLILWLFMRLAGIQIVELLLLPVIVWSACMTVLGWRISVRLIFPFGFLYFAIPVWHSGNFILQWLTVKAVGVLIKTVGFLAHIKGNFVFLTSGTFEIADGCSGLNFFIVGVAITLLYGYLYLPDLRRCTILLLVGVVLAIVMNWIRVFIIIYVGYLTDMQHYLVTVDHTNFGWALFALMFVPLFMIARKLEGAGANTNASSLTPNQVNTDLPQCKRNVTLGIFATTALLIIVSTFEMIQTSSSQESCAPIHIPQESAGWRRVDSLENDWSPVYAGAAEEILRHYDNGRHVVTLYVNLYSDQSQGSELIGYENHIEGSGMWRQQESSRKIINLDQDVSWEVGEILLESVKNERRIIYFWYDVGGHRVIDNLTAKLWQGYSRFVGNSQAGIIAVSSLCTNDDCTNARSALQGWLQKEWADNNEAMKFWNGDC